MKLLEQVVGGFVAPGDEATFEVENTPDYENFVMCAKKLLDGGVSVGELVNKLIELPKVEPKGREENNDYEYPPDALQTLPSFPG